MLSGVHRIGLSCVKVFNNICEINSWVSHRYDVSISTLSTNNVMYHDDEFDLLNPQPKIMIQSSQQQQVSAELPKLCESSLAGGLRGPPGRRSEVGDHLSQFLRLGKRERKRDFEIALILFDVI